MSKAEYDKELALIESLIAEIEELVAAIRKQGGDTEYEELQLISLRHEKNLREELIQRRYGNKN